MAGRAIGPDPAIHASNETGVDARIKSGHDALF
jgi:hypothetical protein